MRTSSVVGRGRALMFVLISVACSSPSEPVLPLESRHLIVSSDSVLLALSDSGGVADTVALLPGRTIVRHEVSPDGRAAAVMSVAPGTPSALHVLSFEGAAPVQITGFSGFVRSFSWSPNSQRLVFSTRLPGEIMTVSSTGAGLDTLVTLPFVGENAHWSPAGDRIVYAGWDSRVSDMAGLWTIRPDGTEATKIADERVFILGTTGAMLPAPRFSPSGEWIAFESNGDLHVIRADGTGRRQLTATPGDEWHFRWSPGGDRIAYIGDGGARWAIRIMSFPEGAPAGAVEYEIPSDRDTAYPEWSPDGERIAFMSVYLLSGVYRPPGEGLVATARGEDFSTWSAAPLPVVLGEGRLPQWWPGH